MWGHLVQITHRYPVELLQVLLTIDIFPLPLEARFVAEFHLGICVLDLFKQFYDVRNIPQSGSFSLEGAVSKWLSRNCLEHETKRIANTTSGIVNLVSLLLDEDSSGFNLSGTLVSLFGLLRPTVSSSSSSISSSGRSTGFSTSVI